MGDRTQRVKGKVEETKGKVKREVGVRTGRPGTEARGAGEELKGKAKNAVGKARSAVKKRRGSAGGQEVDAVAARDRAARQPATTENTGGSRVAALDQVAPASPEPNRSPEVAPKYSSS